MKTEEERREAKKEYDKQRYQANREKILEQHKQYYQVNREKFAEQHKQYRKDNAEKIAEQKKQYYKDNAEKIAEYQKQYYQGNKEKLLEQMKQWREKNADYHKQYYQTPMGRASNLVNAYNREDKKYNRGECTLTAKWMIDRIFSQKCIYCGESDWTKLGCDRIDNSKPHTEDNVVPCCEACNKKRQKKPFKEFFAECNAQKSLETVCLN